MHANEQLLTKLFQCLNAHDHGGMAECYHKNATLQDIAFRLSGRDEIHAMWEMICKDNSKGKSDIQATVLRLKADDARGDSVVVDDYTFRKTGRSGALSENSWLRRGSCGFVSPKHGRL